MAKIVTTLQGVGQLEFVLKRLGPQVAGKIATAALSAGAEIARKETEARAPVRQGGGARRLRKRGRLSGLGRVPGFLRASIQKRKVPAGQANTVRYVVQPSRLAFYGMFQEFGTSSQPARPFLRPALEASRGAVLAKVKARLRQGIEKQAAKLAAAGKARR